MTTTKRILCLANSRKISGRCVAGKEVVDGKPGAWVRPVSARASQEVSEYERQYADGSDPQVLDLIDVPLIEQNPKDYQTENWLLDGENYWRRAGRISAAELTTFVDPVKRLWVDAWSSYSGVNDRIPLSEAGKIKDSLRLLKVGSLTISVFAPGVRFENPKRRVQGRFEHHGLEYRLWITDPIYERRYLAMENGDYPLGPCFLTVSLGEPHNDGYFYKLIAAIVKLP